MPPKRTSGLIVSRSEAVHTKLPSTTASDMESDQDSNENTDHNLTNTQINAILDDQPEEGQIGFDMDTQQTSTLKH